MQIPEIVSPVLPPRLRRPFLPLFTAQMRFVRRASFATNHSSNVEGRSRVWSPKSGEEPQVLHYRYLLHGISISSLSEGARYRLSELSAAFFATSTSISTLQVAFDSYKLALHSTAGRVPHVVATPVSSAGFIVCPCEMTSLAIISLAYTCWPRLTPPAG